jgi:hypothetical protein
MVTEKRTPYVVVLIISYNGKELLEESVSSYLANEYPNFDVIVIDNGSTDGTQKYMKEFFPEASVVRLEKNKGYQGGFNFGFKFVVNDRNPDYILISNNDVRVDSKAIYELVKVAETDSKIGFVTGKVYFYNIKGKRNILQTVGKKSNPVSIVGDHIGSGEEDVGQYDNVEERDFCDDVFLLVRGSVVEKTEGFDEDFIMQYEETDWQFRSKKLGYKIYYTPHAKLWHKVGLSTGGPDSSLRHFNNRRSHILLIKKNGTKKQCINFLLKSIFYDLPISVLFFITRNRLDLAIAHLKGNVSGIIWIINN